MRSSLVDRSFEKCHYCNGTGLILNNSSISDQIIKVIKEKLSHKKNHDINVKCNSVLAESLINIKREEINNLESTYKNKIIFTFDDHYSLHEPSIQIINSNNDKVIKKKIVKESDSDKDLQKTKKKAISKKIPKTKEIKIKPKKKRRMILL